MNAWNLKIHPRRAKDGGERIRRAHALVGHWEGDRFLLRNYLSGRRLQTDPIVMHLLDGFDVYTTPSEAHARLQDIPGAENILTALLEQDVLLREGSAIELLDLDVQASWRWGQEARFFHYATRDVPYERDIDVQRESLLRLMREEPPVGPFKNTHGPQTPVPTCFEGLEDKLGEVLLRRRTRRDFADRPLPFALFTQVLHWTWGSTHVFEDGEIGPYILKTSPSGGARHSIEVYPLVMSVSGLERGVYHYAVEKSALVRLGPAPDVSELPELFGGQPWLAHAPAVFIMASRIMRSDWKYRHAHAYRVLLVDAGHLGQTFHLVCTALGLAPFTLAGFQDSRLEQTLGIDGVREVPLYAAACGYSTDRL